MKKLLLVSSLFLIAAATQAQVTTATDFTVNDCAGTSHNLFSDLDAGKVVVLAFVMPCGSCSAPTITAYNKVMEYESTNPGKVSLYVLDDQGTTSCTTLTNWANSIAAGLPVISDPSAVESAYGSGGMPKIVVVGGGAHGVYFNKNGSASNNATLLESAIDQALLSTGVVDVHTAAANLAVNVSSTKATLTYDLQQASEVNVTLYNTLGSHLTTVLNERQTVGQHAAQIDVNNLSNGIYFVKFQTSNGSQTMKFTVSH